MIDHDLAPRNALAFPVFFKMAKWNNSQILSPDMGGKSFGVA
jgi:hypothetical protein